MNLRTKYKRYFRAACTTLLLLAFVGCAKDKLVEYGPGDATGKVVMVSLKVGIPPAVEPASTSGYSAAKSLFRDRNDSGLSFTVALEQGQEPHEVTTRVSDGTTKLHNLWLFQFDEHGSIKGNPHKLSDAVTAINDLMTIDVPLVVSENQTLYLLVLGPKLNYDMSGVSTLDELKNWSFDYLINVEGHTQSLITADDEVPLAGEVSGVTVVEGRWQKVHSYPDIICDTGHNVDGIKYVCGHLDFLHQKFNQELHIVFGMVNDKDISSVLQELPKDATYYFTKASVKRALPENELLALAEEAGLKGIKRWLCSIRKRVRRKCPIGRPETLTSVCLIPDFASKKASSMPTLPSGEGRYAIRPMERNQLLIQRFGKLP